MFGLTSLPRRFATRRQQLRVLQRGHTTAWPNYDNSIYGGTDAAGSSLAATSIDPNQWYHNVVDNVIHPTTHRVEAISHLLRTTFVNPAVCATGASP